MTSSYDITAMIITPLISYIGGSRKKPLFCAWGLFTMGVGFFIFMLPHFVSPPYQATGRWIRLTFTQFATKSWTLLRSCLPSFSIPCCFFALFLLYVSWYVTRLFCGLLFSLFIWGAVQNLCTVHPIPADKRLHNYETHLSPRLRTKLGQIVSFSLIWLGFFFFSCISHYYKF